MAVTAAREVATAATNRTLPAGIGIRIKPLGEELKRRSLRTFDLFLTALLEAGAAIPPNFVVTLPKINGPEQVGALASVFDAFEYQRDLPRGTLHIELMIETRRPSLPRTGRSRCQGFSLRVAAAWALFTSVRSTIRPPVTSPRRTRGWTIRQATSPDPYCRWRLPEQECGCRTDRPTSCPSDRTALPTGRSPPRSVTKHAGRPSRLAGPRGDIHRSLVSGFYQGWDLHPAQLPSRYAAVYGFFLESLESASDRLRNFVAKATQATRVGEVFDDAATGQGLLNYFLRAMNCGAIGEGEAAEKSGLTWTNCGAGVFRRFSRIAGRSRNQTVRVLVALVRLPRADEATTVLPLDRRTRGLQAESSWPSTQTLEPRQT